MNVQPPDPAGPDPAGWITPVPARIPGQSQPPTVPPAPQISPPPPAGSAEQRNHLDARLAEYTSLREESLQAISNRIQVMNFAFTSMALILAALLASDVPRTLLILVSLAFVPIASKASALVWLGEYHRSQRAGAGIRFREREINNLLGGLPDLTWETSLYSESTHMGYPYIATVFFMLSTGIFGEVLGGYYLVEAASERHGPLVPICFFMVLIYSLTLEFTFVKFFRKRWVEIRRHSHSA